MPLRIPIFIVVYNRLWCLKRCVASLAPSGQEIIFINNGSTYKPLLEWMAGQPYHVMHMPKIHATRGLYRSIRQGVTRWLSQPKFKRQPIHGYILTDPDIELEHPHGRWLQLMYACLKAHPGATCVGSALRTNDIPDHYPLKKQAIACERWCKKKPVFKWKGVPIRWSHIDTTLALYRPKYRKNGVAMKAIRMRGPCMAKHLDWYIDPKNMTEDQRLYLKAPEKLTHFGGTTLRNKINAVQSKATKQNATSKPKKIVFKPTGVQSKTTKQNATSKPKTIAFKPTGVRRRKKVQAIMALLQRHAKRK